MKEVSKYSNCFVCGDCNQHGLQARFYYDGDKAVSEVVAAEAFEGYRGIYHGGIVSTLLDEVMIKAILAEDIYAVTAEMTVRFVAPVKTGDKLTFTGRVTKSKGRMYFTEGKATGEDGQVFASATGKYIEARPELKQVLVQSIE